VPIYKTNPLDSAFRYVWIAFVGLFVSVIGFGFSVHDVSRSVLDELSRTGMRNPEVTRGMIYDSLIAPVPLMTGAFTVIFLCMFVYSGGLFLVRAISLLGKN
jgi:hypothetical protein